jgi:aryl-alcohol dehydrogenase-like predicted oxidoreductase
MTKQTVALGGRELTRVGLGTNRLTDTPENRSFLKAAVEAGVQLIDTAHLYTGGESERTIGATLTPYPDDLVVATKGGFNSGDPETIRTELEQSFESLRTETIDVYFLHRVDASVPLADTLAPIAEAHAAGRIRHVGLSEVAVEQILLGRSVVPVSAVQNEYSLEQRKHDEVIDFCAGEGIVFIPFFPLRGGGKTLEEVAKHLSATPQQVKLAWLLRRSDAMLPIPGTRNIEHLKLNLAALDVELSDDDYEQLRAVAD